MKNNPFKYFVFLMLPLLMVATTGCTEDDISMPAGQLPDETPMNGVGGQLCSGRTQSRIVTLELYEDDEKGVEEINYTLTKPAISVITFKAVADETLVDTYNEEYKTDLEALPTDNVSFENEGTLSIAIGKRTSVPVKVSISTERLETGKPYLLALTVANSVANVDVQAEKQKLYYIVNIQEKVTNCEPDFGAFQEIPPLLSNLISVFYVNTESYQPLVVGAWGVKANRNDLYSLGNIVNLKTSTIDYDTTSKRCLFKLGSDLSYVLEHSNKYIRPLQEHERKVCICIENGAKGVGFCNMTDTQIADFVRQVKEVVTRYNLDGVNLWDEDDKYDKGGMPVVCTLSYPKLIKTLREALPGKLLTLVDKGKATEYFYDVEKCGGIEVGRYIDYAWHGYFSSTEKLQIINPSVGGEQDYSTHTRKSIVGLDETCYGSVVVPRYPNNNPSIRQLATQDIAKWKSSGNKKSPILVYGDDLIGNEYGDRENAVKVMLNEYSLAVFMDDGRGWDFENDKYIREKVRYTAGILDWRIDDPIQNDYKKDW